MQPNTDSSDIISDAFEAGDVFLTNRLQEQGDHGAKYAEIENIGKCIGCKMRRYRFGQQRGDRRKDGGEAKLRDRKQNRVLLLG